MSYQDFFGGKRITIMGLGMLGRAVGDAEFLAQCGARITVTDTKSATDLAASVERLSMYSDITFHLGGHDMQDFKDTDMVIKGAGVPLDSPYIEAARQAGVNVYMSTALFAKFALEEGAELIGVTGTRGKSTITYMIHHALANAGRKTVFGGNIRGVSTLALIPHVRAGDLAVLELDSWQLQGFGDLGISPHIAVFSNLLPDHLNYYPDMDRYFADKANIFRHQKKGDSLFVGEQIFERVSAMQSEVRAVVPPAIPFEWTLAIPGEHNRVNASLAAAALRAAGLSDEEVRSGLESFTGVEGRLQFVGEKNGVKMYNDNNATTPEATIAALKALSRGKNIILIMGGSDKGLDMGTLLYEVASSCKRTILLAGSGTDTVVPLMSDYSIYDTVEAAVTEAVQSASPGDVVLFSPGFASFGMFKNEYERNDRFMSAVRSVLA